MSMLQIYSSSHFGTSANAKISKNVLISFTVRVNLQLDFHEILYRGALLNVLTFQF
jgi:hypothetical protein